MTLLILLFAIKLLGRLSICREREGERDRQTDRQTDRERDRERQRETERDRARGLKRQC